MPHLSCPEGDSQKTVTPSAMSQAMTDSVEKGHSVWKEFQRRRNGILVNLEYVVKCELTSIANELEEENAGLLQRNFDSLHRNKVIVSNQRDSISKAHWLCMPHLNSPENGGHAQRLGKPEHMAPGFTNDGRPVA